MAALHALLLLALALMAGAAPAVAETLPAVSWTSRMAAELEPDEPVQDGFVASPIRRGPGLTRHQAGAFTAREWTIGGSRALADAEGSWLEWSVAADGGFDLGRVLLGVRRHPHGPTSVQLELRVDGGGWQVLQTVHGIGQNTTVRLDVDLAALGPVSRAEFRLYGWNARMWNGWLALENLPEAGGKALTVGVSPAGAELLAHKSVQVHRQSGVGCAEASAAAPAGAQAAIPGACIEYRIDVVNTGPGTARHVRLRDVLAAHMVFAGAWHEGFLPDAPEFGLSTPHAMTDCAGGSCVIALEGAALAGGATARIIIRALLR